MALTELQMPDKNTFYVKIKDLASRMRKTVAEWEAMSEYIAAVDASDMDAMGVPASGTDDTRADLVKFRTALTELVSLWNGNAVSEPTTAPVDAINKVRAMY